MRIRFDNRAIHPRNPHWPPRRVKTGDRSEIEMGRVWLQVLPRAPGRGVDPRVRLQELLAAAAA